MTQSAATSFQIRIRRPCLLPKLDSAIDMRYQKSMKSNVKSSITLSAADLRRVRRLKSRLKLNSNVAVVREGLRVLEELSDREALREEFRKASTETREALLEELKDLDHLAGEGLDSW
jgi:class 3 adenylate cyclase